MSMVNQLRENFPFFDKKRGEEPVVYLDNAATTHKPQVVISSCTEFYIRENANVHRSSHKLAAATTKAYEQSRKALQKFINAKCSKEIIWTKGCTESINLVATVLSRHNFKEQDEIVLTCLEHHANIVPWQQLAQHLALNIRVMPVDENGVLEVEKGLQLINEKTAIVAMGHVSNALGNINPVKKLINKAKKCNALTLIDGAQAVAHLEVDVQELDCDFYAFSGHKMYGPTGVGVLYGKKQLLEMLPPYQYGGEMIEKVSFERTTFGELPFKFEAGTPNIQGVLGLSAAVSFLQGQQRREIAKKEQALYRRLINGLKGIAGCNLFGDLVNNIGVVSFTVDGLSNQDLGAMLSEGNIAVRVGHHCAMPLMERLAIDGTLRVSIAMYNTESDIDACLSTLGASIKYLSSITPGGSQSEIASHSFPLAEQLRQVKGWDEHLRLIMLASKSLERMSAHEKIQEHEVAGCESRVWVKVENKKNSVSLTVDSPSKIVRGLLAIMIEPLQGLAAPQVVDFDILAYMEELGLKRHLSESRGNGLNQVMKKIKAACKKLN